MVEENFEIWSSETVQNDSILTITYARYMTFPDLLLTIYGPDLFDFFLKNIILGQKEILTKKYIGRNPIGAERNFDQKIYWAESKLERNFDQKIYWAESNWGGKKFWPKNILGGIQLGRREILTKKYIGRNPIGAERNFDQKIYWAGAGGHGSPRFSAPGSENDDGN